jgi:hypothetical protein
MIVFYYLMFTFGISQLFRHYFKPDETIIQSWVAFTLIITMFIGTIFCVSYAVETFIKFFGG